MFPPVMYEDNNLSALSLTLVSICHFDYSHPGVCEVVLRVPGICFNQVYKILSHGNVMKEEVYYTHRSLEIGDMACHPGPQ